MMVDDHASRAAIPQLIERPHLCLEQVGVDNIQFIPPYGNVRMDAGTDIGKVRIREAAGLGVLRRVCESLAQPLDSAGLAEFGQVAGE